MYSLRASILLMVLLVARLSAAGPSPWSYDVVKGGKCTELVKRQQTTGVTEANGTKNPGKWAVTRSTLFIGAKQADDKEAVNEITFHEEPEPSSSSKQVCVAFAGIDFHLSAKHAITALDWQHGASANSKCAKEWKVVEGKIRSHEPQHASDVDALVAVANGRAQSMRFTGCGKDINAARKKAAAALGAQLAKEVAQIRSDARKKADELDAETATLQCPCEEPIGWRLNFDVTVTGTGKHQADELSHHSWDILQRYKGTIDLTRQVQLPSTAAQSQMAELSKLTPDQLAHLSPEQLALLQALAQLSGPVRWTPSDATSIPLDVEVNSQVSSYLKDPGEADSFEAKSVANTWKGKGKDASGGTATLVLDDAAKTYDLDFEIRPTSTSKQVNRQTKTSVRRSKYGYGGLPTHEGPKVTKSKETFGSFSIPIVKGTLNGSRVTYKALPLKVEGGKLEHDDPGLKPSEPLIPALPQPDNITVHIFYRLTPIDPP
ncbi:MAG TPA: hypothetical protein VHM70_11005 [Polyangiaceae bacterium]|jgi:hypothetical protein|nr:hypothetical protein [Polyangiaceae bacterium]